MGSLRVVQQEQAQQKKREEHLRWLIEELRKVQIEEMYGRLTIIFEKGLVQRVLREHSIIPLDSQR